MWSDCPGPPIAKLDRWHNCRHWSALRERRAHFQGVRYAAVSVGSVASDRNRRLVGSLRHALVLLGAVAVINAPLAQPLSAASQRHPDVQTVRVKAAGPNTFDFDVTIASPYDTAQRYADAFRVMSKDGRVFGERLLLHDHADEQPFTRDLYGVAISTGVRSVIIQARDLKYGYGGKTVEVTLPGR